MHPIGFSGGTIATAHISGLNFAQRVMLCWKAGPYLPIHLKADLYLPIHLKAGPCLPIHLRIDCLPLPIRPCM
jgi:hypothetical protein